MMLSLYFAKTHGECEFRAVVLFRQPIDIVAEHVFFQETPESQQANIGADDQAGSRSTWIFAMPGLAMVVTNMLVRHMLQYIDLTYRDSDNHMFIHGRCNSANDEGAV